MRPYVDRALHDEELRDNLKEAFNAARDVYTELLGNRNLTSTATRVATDKDIQDNLKRTIEELRKATDRVQGKEDHGTRNTILLLTGITMGILFNPMTGPQTRKWLMEKITGESSTTSATARARRRATTGRPPAPPPSDHPNGRATRPGGWLSPACFPFRQSAARSTPAYCG